MDGGAADDGRQQPGQGAGIALNAPIDRFARDLVRLLEPALHGDALGEPALHRLEVAVIHLLSRPDHRRDLLFRDHRATEPAWRIRPGQQGFRFGLAHEAVVYFDRVLGRRLAIPNVIGADPGTLHRLYLLLARTARATGWSTADIRRARPALLATLADLAFARIARLLARQIQALGDGFGPISARRRAEHGPFWLSCGEERAEMPEELSLFPMLQALPLPLADGFAENVEVRRQLARVLGSLNERYALLRGAGLPPEQWYERRGEDEAGRSPDTLSEAVLADLVRLRRRARALFQAERGLPDIAAWRRAFDELHAAGGKARFAGAESFDLLAATNHGHAMLHGPAASLDAGGEQSEGGGLGDRLGDDGAAAEKSERVALFRRWLADVLATEPISPPLRMLLKHLLALADPIAGFDVEFLLHGRPGAPGLLADPAFRALLDADPAWRGLADAAVLTALRKELDALTRRLHR